MYVGGTDFVLKLDVDDYHNREVRFFFFIISLYYFEQIYIFLNLLFQFLVRLLIKLSNGY